MAAHRSEAKMQRIMLVVAATLALATITARAQHAANVAPRLIGFDVVEASITEMQNAMQRGTVTSKELVLQSFARIAFYKDLLNPTISLYRDAVAEAERLDVERAQGRYRGPLHGIPVAVKDNINTTFMPTTGGALAFRGYTPPYDATLITNLKNAGAVIIAKTVMTELANWVTNGMPGNYSAVGGWGMNPYDPRRDPRTGNDAFGIPFNDGRPVMSVAGSSSGIGTAASLWAANVGTETSGSILSPSNQNMLVGIKPTVGRISRWGIIPITADLYTAGPLARCVSDAAIMLGAMEGADTHDPATTRCSPPPGRDYQQFLRLAGLRGKRIGIPRAFYYDPITLPGGTSPSGGVNAAQRAVLDDAIAALKAQGAIVVDPANIPSVLDQNPNANNAVIGTCVGLKATDVNCSTVFKYGFKRDFAAYIASLGPTAPVKSLTELRQFNTANASQNAIRYRQDLLDTSDEMNLTTDLARYTADRARDIFLADAHGIREAMTVNNLDALLFPGSSSAGIAARAGFPTVIVPYGFIPNAPTPALPAGFNAKDQPYGVGFTGTECSEPTLIEMAYAFEQATKKRIRPSSTP
jgi:amidase